MRTPTEQAMKAAKVFVQSYINCTGGGKTLSDMEKEHLYTASVIDEHTGLPALLAERGRLREALDESEKLMDDAAAWLVGVEAYDAQLLAEALRGMAKDARTAILNVKATHE